MFKFPDPQMIPTGPETVTRENLDPVLAGSMEQQGYDIDDFLSRYKLSWPPGSPAE